jgi:spore coat protein U-like protein
VRPSPWRALLAAALLGHASLAFASCTVNAPSLSFGPYDPLSGAPATTSGNVTVNCNLAPAPTVTIMLGPSAVSGGFSPRQMRQDGGAELLAYNFFADAAGTSVWGDGSGGTVVRSARVLKNQPWSATIYGRIPPGQDVQPGSYADTLTITIDF